MKDDAEFTVPAHAEIGAEYHVEICDCCVAAQFTSVLAAREPGDESDAISEFTLVFSNGVRITRADGVTMVSGGGKMRTGTSRQG